MKLPYQIDERELRKALPIFLPTGRVTELRVLNCRVDGEYRSGTYSGYYDGNHHDKLIADLKRIIDASAAYFVPNELSPDLLARSPNEARIITDRTPITSDKDIVRRLWLLIDVDAKRAAGISATDEEKAATLEVATAIDNYFWERGWPPGIIGDSGNGSHLMLPYDLPADDKGLVKRLLADLAAKFNTEKAVVDETVHNASRIWKLPGTEVRKGGNCPDLGRVWRMSKLLTICTEIPDDA